MGVWVAKFGGGVLVVRDEEVGEAGVMVGGRGVGGWRKEGKAVGRRFVCSGDWRRGRVDMRRFYEHVSHVFRCMCVCISSRNRKLDRKDCDRGTIC